MAYENTILDVLYDNEIRKCGEDECGGELKVEKRIENNPKIYSLCIGWDSNNVSKKEIEIVCDKIQETVPKSDVLPHNFDIHLWV